MPICVAEQDSRKLDFPIVIGGAAINREFGKRIALLDEGSRYFEPGVFYAKDAFEGLEIMDVLTSADAPRREAFLQTRREDVFRARDKAAVVKPSIERGVQPARELLSAVTPPKPPFWGAKTVTDINLRELWPCFDLKSLFRLSWGGASAKGEQWETLLREEFEPRLKRYQEQAEREHVLEPRAVYGYFPAAGSGDDVIVYDPADPSREISRFPFSRQVGGEHLCLADYLREPDGGRASDVIALQVVTMGRHVSTLTEALQAANDYSESYFLHGFSVQSAEAFAELTHRRIRHELGLPVGTGKRYSWGYGACPDLSQHEIVWRLLDVERAIGAELTEAFQIIPEQSTAAIIMHHPQAAYFNAAATRELTAV
jgi:5-methyltetrahydrofolate--homocysteine methyltransferase